MNEEQNKILKIKEALETPVEYLDKNYISEIEINGTSYEFEISGECKTTMGKTTLNKINKFDKETWNSNSDGIDSGFTMINKAFHNGLVPGFYIIAGDSNLGKTSFSTQLIWQILHNNENVFILDFTLDDSEDSKISRLVGSWVQLNSNAVKYPNGQDIGNLLRRRIGLNNLVKNSDKYQCFDSASTEANTENKKRKMTDIETIEYVIRKTIKELDKDENKKTQIVVMIDSFHDLSIEALPTLQDTPKFNKIASWAAELQQELGIVLMCTAEIKKLEKDGVRPSLGSIRESIKIRYEADAIILLYNDVHYNSESAEVFFLEDGNKSPILEAHVAKNKLSDWKGRIFYKMFPKISYFIECTEDETRRYRAIIAK